MRYMLVVGQQVYTGSFEKMEALWQIHKDGNLPCYLARILEKTNDE